MPALPPASTAEGVQAATSRPAVQLEAAPEGLDMTQQAALLPRAQTLAGLDTAQLLTSGSGPAERATLSAEVCLFADWPMPFQMCFCCHTA